MACRSCPDDSVQMEIIRESERDVAAMTSSIFTGVTLIATGLADMRTWHVLLSIRNPQLMGRHIARLDATILKGGTYVRNQRLDPKADLAVGVRWRDVHHGAQMAHMQKTHD